MAEIDVITQLIGSFGFPIAACIALFYQMLQLQKSYKSDTDKFVEAINSNTNSLNLLQEKLDAIK